VARRIINDDPPSPCRCDADIVFALFDASIPSIRDWRTTWKAGRTIRPKISINLREQRRMILFPRVLNGHDDYLNGRTTLSKVAARPSTG
jgi:hypothetical protein